MHRRTTARLESLESRTLLSTTPATFVDDAQYSNLATPTSGLFRDIVGGDNINRGADAFGGTTSALNFGNAATAGRGVTAFDATPSASDATIFAGSVTLNVDLVQGGTNANLPGLFALFNEGSGQRGLALAISEAGNTDLLELHWLPQNGDLTSANRMAFVTLSGGIQDGAWYHLTMDLKVSGDTFTVIGTVTDVATGKQVGKPLQFTSSLAKWGLKNAGQVGMFFDSGAATSKASFTNFAIASDNISAAPAPSPAPAPEPLPAPAPEPIPTPLPAPAPTPAATVTAAVVNGQLQITGTQSADAITVSQVQNALNVLVAGRFLSFTGVNDVVIWGAGGDDAIRADHTVATTVQINGGDGNDYLYDAGKGVAHLSGDAGDDTLVTVGGGHDSLTGGAGLDSFWLDSTDTVTDAAAAETAARTVHRIGSFLQPTATAVVSMEIAGQNLVDPVSSFSYSSYAAKPLFVDGPEFNDVRQGNVGDCYFMASLAAVASSDPSIIRQMITSLGDGTYAVRLYRGTTETYVRVDADLSGFTSATPAYAGLTPDGELWVALVEKAFAQFRSGANSYASIHAGWMSEAFSAISGTSSTWRSTAGTVDSVVQFITTHLNAGHAITAATKTHAYMVGGVQLVSGQWQVQLYDPYGASFSVSVTTFQQSWLDFVVNLA